MTETSASSGSGDGHEARAGAIEARGAKRRVALTAVVVAAILGGTTTAAWLRLKREHAAYLEVSVEAAQLQARQEELPVSRYQLASSTPDGRKIRVHLWVDTPHEYALDVEAGKRESARAAGAGRSATDTPLERAAHSERDGLVVLDDGERLRFTTFEEPCPGGTMTSWRLCPAEDDGGCIVAPVADRCYAGALRLVELYRGTGALWAVVERRMGNRVARMVAGVPLDG